jgi:hypothetical protein
MLVVSVGYMVLVLFLKILNSYIFVAVLTKISLSSTLYLHEPSLPGSLP